MNPVAAGGVTQMEVDVFKLSRYLEEAGHPCDGDAANTLRALKLQLTAAQAEADRLRVDAERWMTLREHFKSDHIFYHVLGAPAGYESVEDAIDAVTAAGTWEVLHPDTAIHAAKTEQGNDNG